MIPSGLIYSQQSVPNLPSSVTNFSGPVLFSRQRLQNINCIIDPSEDRGGLFLGDTISIKRTQYLVQYNIQAILSCAYEAMFMHPGDSKLNIVDTKFICAMDSMTYEIEQHFEESYNFIQDNLANKNNVLVHCHAGVSRSAAIVIAYVMKKYGLNFDAAFEFVRRRRPRIRPNQNFRNRLKEFEKSVLLNSSDGNLGEEQLLLQMNNPIKNESLLTAASFTSTPVLYDKISTSTERFSENVDGYQSVKIDPFLGKKEDNGGVQTSSFSISELLLKSEKDAASQRQLEARFNDFTTQLQKQTHNLFGREQLPRRTLTSINSPYYGTQMTHPYPTYDRPHLVNPQRNISYKPVQTESIRTTIEKQQMTRNKSKVTVVQGGLPDSYKSIAGMMAPSGSRYENGDYYKRY